MSILLQKANAVSSNLYAKGETGPVAFDTATIEIIMAIISVLVAVFKYCNKTPQEAIDKINNLGMMDYARLRLEIIKKCGLFCRINNQRLRESIIEVGKSTTIYEMSEMYKETSELKSD